MDKHATVSLAKLQRALKKKEPLSTFLRSSGCRDALAHLVEQGYPEESVLIRTRACPGQPAEAMVHPLIAVEYLRWADYSVYAKRIGEVLK